MRAYLQDVISLGQGDLEVARLTAVVNKGLDTFDTLSVFAKDNIKSLYQTIRKLGGRILNPDYVPPPMPLRNAVVTAVPLVSEFINNPG